MKKLTFRVKCHTRWGQDLVLVLNACTYTMRYIDEALWEVEVPVVSHSEDYSTGSSNSGQTIKPGDSYHYEMEENEEEILQDAFGPRVIPDFSQLETSLLLCDQFRFKDQGQVFKTKAFRDSLCKQKEYLPFPTLTENKVIFIVDAPVVKPHEGVAIVGEPDRLGAWVKPYIMRPIKPFLWAIDLPREMALFDAMFKFVIYDKNTGEIVRWDLGMNRRIPFSKQPSIYQYVFEESYEDWHGTGVAIPVFSLRTSDSWGVGEFLDMKSMVDWAQERHHELLQILPINDTTTSGLAENSYPYRANSVHALHPQYIHLPRVGKIRDAVKDRAFRKEAKALNALKKYDYEKVNALKQAYLLILSKEMAEKTKKDKDFQKFFLQSKFWLLPYACFRMLTDRFHTADFRQWGEYADFASFDLEGFVSEHESELFVYYFTQYHLALQLTEAHNYVLEHGMVLKGDLPIGISGESVDAWMAPQLFNLDKQAGAPPDDFTLQGQNWGFPTYNWEAMAQDGYTWWKRRFENMALYFDAFRIDHILGFFRIWEIPCSSIWGLLGHFSPSIPLSTQEIEQYGLWFDRDRFLKPFLTRQHLQDLFKGATQRILDRYFDLVSSDLVQFKPFFDTQVKLASYINQHDEVKEDRPLLDLLLGLFVEVIFIEDDRKPLHYHPSFNALKSFSFFMLSEDLQAKIRQIYNEYFFYRHTEFWKQEAMKKLPALLSATDMLVCGEDLGLVPSCVPEVMKALNILSLEVERMPKDTHKKFILPNEVPYLAVSTTGSHDTSTLRGWWLENPDLSASYYHEALHHEGPCPRVLSTPLLQQIVNNQMHTKAMWSILPFQDYKAAEGDVEDENPLEERINIPSNPKHIWCWRQK